MMNEQDMSKKNDTLWLSLYIILALVIVYLTQTSHTIWCAEP